MKTLGFVAAAASTLVLGAALLGACQARSGGAGDTLLVAPSQAAAGGVGVVRRLDVLVAYTKSPLHGDQIQALMDARDAARAAGRQDEVARIEALGAEMQEIAHRQLAGTEPLYNVLLAVGPDLRAIMESRGLARVLEAGPGVEGVDITDELIAAIERRASAHP
jgi:hypothetical protein